MQKTLSAELKRVSKDKVGFEITKDNYETFCNREDFIETLNKSEADHRAGLTIKRQSLLEIVEKA